MANASNQGGAFTGTQRRTEMGGTSRPGGQTHEKGASGVMEAATEKVQEMASSVASQAEQAWESTRRGVQDMSSGIASGAEDAWESVSGFMSRYPVPMFFVGIGIGFLMARAFDSMPTNMTRHMSDYSAR